MTSPDSETAWHFSSFGTEPDDNQRMGCSSVPSVWLAKVPERILNVAPLRSTSLNALFPIRTSDFCITTGNQRKGIGNA